jgi:hypothetical protein
MNRRTLLVLGTGGLLVSRSVFAAEDASPARLRGKVDSVSGDNLALTLRSGDKARVQLPSGTRFIWLTESKLSEIKPGSYVGTAAVAQPDGTLKALEMQVFPASMRGVGEGNRPWDLGAGSSMTNGTVGSLTSTNGRMITITYKGGEKHVLVPDNVPVVTYEPADMSDLKPGANVLVNGMRHADGSVVASSVSIGKNGLVPPM